MKCSVCKNYSPHLTKVEKKLFCDHCKPNLMKLELEAASIKQEIDPRSDNNSDSSFTHFSTQKKLKREINLQEDDETVDSEDRKLDTSFNSVETDDNAGTSDSSWNISTPTVAKPEKKYNIEIEKVKKLKCHLCGYRCNTLTSMETHRKKNHPELGTIRQKINDEHGGLGAKCQFCLEIIKKHERLAHQRECEGRNLFSCSTCGKRYVKLESLRNHLDEHGVAENQKDLSIVRTRTKEQLLICVICEEGLVYEEEPYWKHVKEQHDGHYLRCDDCGATHKDSCSWRNHRNNYCKIGTAQDRFIAREVSCPHCPKCFKDQTSLTSHMRKNHNENTFSCNECEMKFTTHETYRNHQEKVHSKPMLECPQCPKKFHHLSQLKSHLPLHERGPLECQICGITFKFNAALLYHNHIKHRKREAFECTQCSRRFNLRSHYTRHMREKHGVGSRKNTSQTIPTAALEKAVEK